MVLGLFQSRDPETRWAMSVPGTNLVYGAMHVLCDARFYAISGTQLACSGTMPCAIHGTEFAYAGTRR
eukprot:3477654-Rhodomonas_salina.1